MKRFYSLLLGLILAILATGVVFAEGPTTLSYRAHVQDIGWMEPVGDGEIAGTTGQAKHLEALEISDSAPSEGSLIQYRAHVADIGWQDYVQNGQQAGTTGKNKAIEAVQIRLAGPVAETYDIYYRAHVANLGWLDWAKNDELAGTEGFALPAEAIEIRLVTKDAPAPGETARAGITPDSLRNTASVNYITAIDGVGWQPNSTNGQVSGSTGKNMAIDGVSISAVGIEGGINYRVATWSYGWMDWKRDAEVAGMPGRGQFIEGMQAQLYGKAAYLYDVYYSIHNSDVGWLGWAKNGEETSTKRSLKRTEAIRVMILPKRISPEGYDANATKVVREEFERPASAVGRNYIYVSIPRQQLLYINPQNEIIFQTPVVTGQTGKSETPRGNFSLLSKQREVNLIGVGEVTHVHFWLPFIGKMYGIHDADGWRSGWEYGGRTYDLNGSEGCVNLPYQSIAALNNFVSVGDPVIIR